MNKTYKSVWNESLGTYVAAAEVTTSGGRRTSSARQARRTPQRQSCGQMVLEPRIVFDAALPATIMEVQGDEGGSAADTLDVSSGEADPVDPVPPAISQPADQQDAVASSDGPEASETETEADTSTATEGDGARTEDAGLPGDSVDGDEADADASAVDDGASGPEGADGEIRQEIIFVDSVAEDVVDYLDGHPGEIYVLDAGQDGIEQMAEILSGRTGVDAVHVISHGSAGRLDLGSGELSTATLSEAYAQELAVIRAALSDEADLLLYGCDVGAGEEGQAFVDALAEATGADVLASSDATGADVLGGDWVLEVSSGGEVQTEVIAASDWVGLMTTAVDTGGGAVLAVSGKNIYSVDVTTGKATLLTTVPATVGGVNTGDRGQNSLAVDQTNGLIYYCAEFNAFSSSNTALFAYDYVNDQHILVDANLGDNGVAIGSRGLASGGAVFANGSLYLGVENNYGGDGGGTSSDDAIYRVNLSADGRSVVGSTLLVGNITGNDWGDLGYDPTNNTLLSVASTVVTRYNATTGALVGTSTVPSGTGTQVSTSQLGSTYLVGGSSGGTQRITTYDASTNTLGASVNITTDGTTLLGDVYDAAGWVPPTATIGDRVFTDVNANGVMDGADTGVGGVTIQLVDDVNNNGVVDAGERILATDTTNAAGEYAFTGVLPGNYIVRVTDTNGVLTGRTYTTSGGPTNANADVTQVGSTINTIDFGLANRAPVNALPGTQTVAEDTPLAISGVSVTDPDGNLSTTQLSITHGVISVTTVGTATITSGGNGTGTLTLSGSQADINATLATLVYQPGQDFNGSSQLTVVSTDVGGLSDTDSLAITVTPVNDAPLNSVPGAQSTSEDTPLVFSASSGNALTVSDVDSATLTTTISVTQGVFTLGSMAGVTVSGNGTSSVTLSGSAAAINAALSGASYASQADYNGSAQLTMVTSDGQLGDTDTVAITVTPVADTVTDYVTTAEDTPITFNVLTGAGGAEADNFEGGAQVTATTNPGNGSITVAPNGTITYTPSANFNGSDSFTYTVTSEGVTETETVHITVTPVNDAPTASSIPDQADSDSDPVSLDVSGSFDDVDRSSNGDSLTFSATGLPAGLSIHPTTGVISGTLDAAASQGGASSDGIYSVTVTATDLGGLSASQTFTWTVGNPAPTATDNVYTVGEDDAGASLGNVISGDTGAGTDSDPDGDSLTVSEVNGVAGNVGAPVAGSNGGLFTVNADGTVSFDPNGAFEGLAVGESATSTVTYTISDGQGGTDTATITVTITGENDAPVAVDDAVSTDEDTPVTVAVLPNDTDVDGDTLTVTAVTQGANGTVAIDPVSGNPVYTPDADFVGTDTFTWTVGNPAPTATDNVYTVGEDDAGASLGNVISGDTGAGTDSDPDGDSLTVSEVNGVAGNVGAPVAGSNCGLFTVNADGTVSFDPNGAFEGLAVGESATSTVTYTVSDGQGGTDTATITVTITGENDAPVAVDDAVSTDEDTPVTVAVLPNDTDVDGDTLTVTAVTQGTNGTVAIDPVSGNPVYTPNADFVGTDTFTYTISDGNGGTDTATVTVTINPVNDAPVAVDDAITVTEDTPYTSVVDLDANDTDVDGDALTVVAGTFPTTAGGTIVIAVDGSYTYTPPANFTGTDTVDYTVTDGVATDVGTLTITVTPVNDAPVAVDDAITVTEDTPYTSVVDLDANDTDVDGDALTVVAGTFPTTAGGTIVIAVDGSYTYTPPANFTGTDTVDYTVTDGVATDVGTLTITVTPVNDAPVAVDDAVSTDEDTPVTVVVLPNDTDVDGDTLTVTAVTQGTNGTVAIDPVSGNPVYTPNADFVGTDTFTYTISDGNGGTDTATVTVTINPVNDAPVAVDDAVSTDEDTPVTVAVLPNDTDVDGDTLTVTAVTQGANGTVAIDPVSGNPVYTPNADFVGTDTFTYTISDGNGGTDTATVTVTINPVNDAPVAVDDAITVTEDTPYTSVVDLDANDTDVDGDALTVVAGTFPTTAGGTIVIAVDGSYTYTPPANFTGTDTVDYTVTDGVATDVGTLTITVTPINDAPVAVDDAVSTDEDTPVTVAVLPNDTDVDGDTLTVTAVTQGANGTVAIDPVSGNPVYTPNADFVGTDTFTYTISDGNGGTDTATVTVTINPVNDAPVALDDGYTAAADAPLSVVGDALGNDTDVDGDTLTVSAVNGSAASVGTALAGSNGGLFTVNADGTVSFDPNGQFDALAPGATATTTVSYTISDGAGGTDTATITVTVTGINNAPVATDNVYTVGEDDAGASLGNVISGDTGAGTDSDIDGGTLTVAEVNGVAGNVGAPVAGSNGGLFTVNADGTVSFDPNGAFEGLAVGESATSTVTYTISDGQGGTDTATITVTITGENDAPVAVDDAVSTDEDTPVTVAVLPNDTDVDGDTLTVTAVTQGANGTVAIDPVSGNPVYTPDADFVGTDTFTYTISDGNGGTDTATVTVTINPVNDAPVAVDDAVSTDEDTPVTVAVLPNDTDVDGDTLTVTSVTQGTNGTVAIDPVSGNPVYTPNADFVGTDTFTYTISDGNGGTDTATVTVTINPVNDAPVAVDDAITVTEDTPYTSVVDLDANDTDVDGDALTVVAGTFPTTAGGTIVIAVDGSYTYIRRRRTSPARTRWTTRSPMAWPRTWAR
ncbi:MAG: Ig-like domain-containing protein [Burkholderiaceae bacterium]